MTNAYTPGLKVSSGVKLVRLRRLPLPGDTIVQIGQHVDAETFVARTQLPGQVQSANVANILGVQPDEVKYIMLKKAGEPVDKDEILASTKGIFGLFKTQWRSPVDGKIESISDITGQVIIRKPEIPVEINAYVSGTVIDILENEGVKIETYGTFIQGIFGIGGEAIGTLVVACDNPGDILTPDKLSDDLSGKIVVGGSLVSVKAIKKAEDIGIKGIVTGGIDDNDLKELLGYEIGVAITGSEDLPFTLMITEGFGKIAMAERTFNLFKNHAGMKASISGATQIRAGVIRPEVIIPDVNDAQVDLDDSQTRMSVGSEVRIIREPYFGKLGEVTELISELQELETEARVRVLKVKIKDISEIVVLPRANVEITSL
ncbi:hypothetical protein GF312_13330 [Candidatus Poribacteria bacterium]|nr:hypothetical protein [Candidatus Poribacteria bacterium]